MKILKILLPIALFFTGNSAVQAETRLFTNQTGDYGMSCISHNKITFCQIQDIETKKPLLTINLTDQKLTKEGSLYCFEQTEDNFALLACYDKFPMPNKIGISVVDLTNRESTPPQIFTAVD